MARAKRRRVLVVGDRRKGRVAALARALEPSLAQRLEVVDLDLDGRLDLTKTRADLVLVLGGDGSILQTARRLGANPIPLMGVNLGNLGFLATVSADESPDRIARYAAGDLSIEVRGELAVELITGKKKTALGDALNDAVIDRGAASRLVTLGVRINGERAFETRGDGLVISTPTGSTAYALASGGPILHPGLDVILVTPICPHSLTNRPVVVPHSSEIEVEILDAEGPARVSVDGIDALRDGVGTGDRVRTRCSARTVRLAVLPGDGFYARLRNKLHFAHPPER